MSRSSQQIYEIAHNYVNDRLTGKAVANKKLIAMCRQLRTLEERCLADVCGPSEWSFDHRVVQLFVHFVETAKTGAGKNLKLLDWQIATVFYLLGVKYRGKRWFIEMTLLVPRKNGKSSFAAWIQLFLLAYQKEYNQTCACGSSTENKARIAVRYSQTLINDNPEWSDYWGLSTTAHSVTCPATNNIIIAVAGEGPNSGNDGLMGNVVLLDELHFLKNRTIEYSLSKSMANAAEPMMLLVSTAGMNIDNLARDIYNLSEQILIASDEPQRKLILIFEPDAADREDKSALLTDPNIWRKANPSLGSEIMSGDIFELDSQKVQLQPANQANFFVKSLNLWTQSSSIYIDENALEKVNKHYSEDELKDEPFIIGMDGALKMDLYGIGIYYPEINHITSRAYANNQIVKSYPRIASMIEADDTAFVIDAPVTNPAMVVEHLQDLLTNPNLMGIYYDPDGHTAKAIEIIREMEMDIFINPFFQKPQNLSRPIRALENDIRNEALTIDLTKLLFWQFLNCEATINGSGQIKIDKPNAMQKIDSVDAIINAFGGHAAYQEYLRKHDNTPEEQYDEGVYF